MCLGAMAAGSLGVGGLGKYAYDQRKERKKLQNEVKETRLENESLKGEQANFANLYSPDRSTSKAPTTNTSQRQY